MLTPGVRFMVLSALCFSVMSVLVKLAGQRLPSGEIVLVRAVISLALSWSLLARARISVWGKRRGLLLVRGVFGCLGLHCVFYALTRLPLAEATVLQYLHPMFTAVLAALFLGERVGARLVACILLSTAGVVAVSRPGLLFGASAAPLDPVAVLVAVGGAFFSGCAYVVVRRLSATEHPLVIVFYSPLVTGPLTLPAVAADLVWPRGWEWLILLGVGVFTQLGQVYLTYGMRHEPAGRAAALSYLQVVFAAVWGAAFFGDVPGYWTAAGAALILTGAYVNVRHRSSPKPAV